MLEATSRNQIINHKKLKSQHKLENELAMLISKKNNPHYRLRRNFLIILCAGIIFLGIPMPKAKAMDPVTIGILAPILMPYAIKAADYAVRGIIKTGPGWIKAGTQVLNIFRLPLGLGQIFLGFPFGLMGYGFGNIAKGAMAPFLLIKEILCMPLYFFGMS